MGVEDGNIEPVAWASAKAAKHEVKMLTVHSNEYTDIPGGRIRQRLAERLASFAVL